MKTLIASTLVLALAIAVTPGTIVASAWQTGEIAGTAVVGGKPLARVAVRLRNIDNDSIVANDRTNEKGEYRFTALAAGNYVVETVDDKGVLLGTSTKVTLAAGAMIAGGVTVSTSAAAAVGGVGAVGAAGAAAGGITATAAVVTTVAVGAGVAAVVVVSGDASPSGG
jgi:hypothetical protein